MLPSSAMDLILCHTTADFDTLGAAVGLTRLHPGARIVLTGGAHPTVKEFLALHRDEYALIERRSVSADQIRSLIVVDTQSRDRLGKAAEWLDLPDVKRVIYDHHLHARSDIEANERYVEAVGATTTLITEQLQHRLISLNGLEATVMALGIHVDTGSLTYDHTTVRDAAALTWLMQQGANLGAIAAYVEPGLSPQLQDLLTLALETLHTETIHGYCLSWVLLPVEGHIPGLSGLASSLLGLMDCDGLLLGATYPTGEAGDTRTTVIGRWQGPSATQSVNLGTLFQTYGGGGHARAAALTLRGVNSQDLLNQLLQDLRRQIPHPPIAQDLMSSPVRTIRPETTIADAQRLMLRYGHSGLSIVDAQEQLVGIISRRDIDIALHHGFSHAPVKGYMTPNLKTITPNTSLPEIEALMVTYDIGRLPVLENGRLVGIVTRTDVLRQLHQEKAIGGQWHAGDRTQFCPLPQEMQRILRGRVSSPLWDVLMTAAEEAEQRGWQLYLVGGAVRDLLLAAPTQSLLLKDIDLVVDGFHRSTDEGAGVELAQSLQARYPASRLQIHGRFQTAALVWHNDPQLDSLLIDIATARTEFYPYPAANPEVEASSIRQDLYRRDFTINALAIRLSAPRSGELLDFFGGLLDLHDRQIRVLHANSVIEDPTRIFRAVRFAVRLGFHIEPQTQEYIHHAIASGIYHRVQEEVDRTPALQTRLRRELKLILEAPYWKSAIQLLSELGALRCLHPSLEMSDRLWHQLRLVDRWLKRFDQHHPLEHWQMLLETLITTLAPDLREPIALNLQLPADSIQRLSTFAATLTEVETQLPTCDRPSQIVKRLEPFDLPMLLLLAIHVPRAQRRLIWRYLTNWATVKPPLDGNDLKNMGYKPGKLFKPMLDALRAATLDGVVGDRPTAEEYVRSHFPKTAHHSSPP